MGGKESKSSDAPPSSKKTLQNDKQPVSKKTLSAQIVSKDTSGSSKVSKKETLKVLHQQENEIRELIDKLNLQIRKDELAARRFLALEKPDYARLGLKKRKYHDHLKTKISERLFKTTDLLEQIENDRLRDSVKRNIDKTEELCEEIRRELEVDYIANARRPHVDLRSVHDELDSKGFTDDSVVDDLNNLWMQDVESCLADSEIMEQWKDDGHPAHIPEAL